MNDATAEMQVTRRIAHGDTRAFAALMRRHSRMLFRAARAILRDDAEAEDALQEAWLRAYRAIGTFRGEARLSTWLVRIAANEALARRRKAVRGPEMLSLGEASIRALPEAFRDVFMLRAVQELSVEETAEALGLPPATVKTRLFRARRRLRQAMAAA